MKKLLFLVFAAISQMHLSHAQGITIGDNNGKITFEEYEPKSTLVVPE